MTTNQPSASGFRGYLREVRLERRELPSENTYPFSLPALRDLDGLRLHPQVTFLVGENGSGKSTLIEGIAVAWGFNPEGGSLNFRFETRPSHSTLARYLTLVKEPIRPRDGFFLRAESFFNLASEIERLDEGGGGRRLAGAYGGQPLHEQSHGEAFLSLFTHRFRGRGLYLLDEPEAALSPTRQMALLARMHQLVRDASQFIIATHSPIVMAYPDAEIVEFSPQGIRRIAYSETEHYAVTAGFINNRERMLARVMGDATDR